MSPMNIVERLAWRAGELTADARRLREEADELTVKAHNLRAQADALELAAIEDRYSADFLQAAGLRVTRQEDGTPHVSVDRALEPQSDTEEEPINVEPLSKWVRHG